MAVDFSFFNWKGLADGAACPLGDSPLSSTISTAAKKIKGVKAKFCLAISVMFSHIYLLLGFLELLGGPLGHFLLPPWVKAASWDIHFEADYWEYLLGKYNKLSLCGLCWDIWETWSQSDLLNLSYLFVLRQYIFRNLEYLISSILWKTYLITDTFSNGW